MKTEQIVAKLSDRKGQFVRVRLTSNVPCLAAHRANIVQKFTEMTVVTGIAFENRKDVKDAIADGTRGEVEALPWGEWKQFLYVISHKNTDYIRLYLPSQAQRESGFCRESSVQFTCNGQPISRAEAIVLCGSKAESRENEFGCMTAKAENIAIVE